MLNLFDTKSKKIKPFTSMQENRVYMYICGPTVYDNSHLGHARGSVVFDLLRRVLISNNYKVNLVRNVTDIDDKIIARAKSEDTTKELISEKYLHSFHEDLKSLNVLPATMEPLVTKNLDAIFTLIDILLEKDIAYSVSNGDIYFDISKDSEYLSLSKKDMSNKQNRVENHNREKRNSSDFALWKADTENAFYSPYGLGRPGWHIECSALINKFFLEHEYEFQIDIHGGGSDLVFPHHENEAAQTRAAFGKELSNFWVHNGMVKINEEKMSKSLGNSFFIKEALKDFSGEELRFYLLSVHYRNDFNYSIEDLKISIKRLEKLYRLKERVYRKIYYSIDDLDIVNDILSALNEDLNISKALSLIDKQINVFNEELDSGNEVTDQVLSFTTFLSDILGIGFKDPKDFFRKNLSEEFIEYIELELDKRSEAKLDKNYSLADSIRDNLLKQGISINDHKEGTSWEKI